VILLRGTSSEISLPESLRIIGTDSIPAAVQLGGRADAGTASVRADGQALFGVVNDHKLAATQHATKQNSIIIRLVITFTSTTPVHLPISTRQSPETSPAKF